MNDSSRRMPLIEALTVLRDARDDKTIVVSTMGAAREWSSFEQHPLDFVYVPSSMGQATSVALGLSVAKPDHLVVTCNGDGSMLMNLGSLVTITARRPRNLIVLVMDNGIYEVTGRQATPGSSDLRSDSGINFADVARSCGFETVFEFDDVEQWRDSVSKVLSSPGPVFATLKVSPFEGDIGPKSPGPAWQRAEEFRRAVSS